MAPPIRRTSTPARTPAAGPARRSSLTPGAGKGEVVHTAITGDTDTVFARMQKEHQKLDARREASTAMSKMPFRFWVTPGETKEIIIVDEGITFARNEHACKNPRTQHFDLFLPCIAEVANCPVCATHPDKQPYFAAFLTIIDLTPYTDKTTDEEVPFSKRLLEIKPMQQKKFMRLQQQHGTLRGMVLSMTRDTKKDARIGNDIEYAGERLSEEDLQTYVRIYTDRAGKEQEILGYEPFNYEEIFPDMSEEQLRAICNGAPDPGSRAFENEELGDEADDGFGDAPAPARRAARGTTAPQRTPQRVPQRAGTVPVRREAPLVDNLKDDEIPFEEGGEEAAETPPARSSSIAASRAALRHRQ